MATERIVRNFFQKKVGGGQQEYQIGAKSENVIVPNVFSTSTVETVSLKTLLSNFFSNLKRNFIFGSSSSVKTAAEPGLVPSAGASATTAYFLNGTGKWSKPPNTTYSTYTSSSTGGLISSAQATTSLTTASTATYFLTRDAKWSRLPATAYANATYSTFSSATSGLVKAPSSSAASTGYVLTGNNTWKSFTSFPAVNADDKGLMTPALYTKLHDDLTTLTATTARIGYMSTAMCAKLGDLTTAVATTTKKGYMSAADKVILNNLNSYEHQAATASSLSVTSAQYSKYKAIVISYGENLNDTGHKEWQTYVLPTDSITASASTWYIGDKWHDIVQVRQTSAKTVTLVPQSTAISVGYYLL